MSEVENWRNFQFVGFTCKYYSLCTDSPIVYPEHAAIGALGHAMGYESINLIQPRAVHHNVYIVFVGESTWTRKSTSQDFVQDIYPQERTMLHETTPERFIARLAEDHELFQFLGEFSGLLKGITGEGGYMTRLAELYNDLHRCPEIWGRERMERDDGRVPHRHRFIIRKCYLSVLSTVTPEMLKENLTNELMIGGWLARYMLVFAEPNPRPRERLSVQAFDMREKLGDWLNAVINMRKDGTNFILSDQALARYNEIEKYAIKRYDKVSPFVGRYLNYLIAYADILLVSDAIGIAVTENTLFEIKHLRDLVRLKSEVIAETGVDTLVEANSGDSLSNVKRYIKDSEMRVGGPLIVSSEYIDRAWRIIEPCLSYASELVDYVELDTFVAKLMVYMKKVQVSTRSKAMQYTHLNAYKMDIAERTLIGMGLIVREPTNAGIVFRWIAPEDANLV